LPTLWSGFESFGYGDANGDGCSDLALGHDYGLKEYWGIGTTYWMAGPRFGEVVLEDGEWSALLTGIEASDDSGGTIAVGDFDGDGLDDLAVGAFFGGPDDLGAAYIVYSPVSGEFDLGDADATMIGSSAYTPYSMSSGDVHGDGLDDLAVAYTPRYDATDQIGKIYIADGAMSGTLDLTMADVVVEDDELSESNGTFGWDTSLHGDFDADGLSDLVVSAIWRNEWESGAVFVLFAPFVQREYVSSAGARLDGPAGSRTGFSVSSGGDVNADGYDDLLVGTAIESSGRAYFLLGPLSVGAYTSETVDGTVEHVESLSYLGLAVSAEQDLNGDGRDDVAVGARNSSAYTPQTGTTYIFYDAPIGHVDAGDADAFVHSEEHMEFDLSNGMGSVVEPAGDMNGDGYDELLIGSTSNYYFYVLFGGPM